MAQVPAGPLRSNLATWAVPRHRYCAVAGVMVNDRSLTYEKYDLGFHGQRLETTYFDTSDLDLYKARKKGKYYLTLRLRCYGDDSASDQEEVYALSAKTEGQKWRQEIAHEQADAILDGSATNWPQDYLPGDLLARLSDIGKGSELAAVVQINAHRYAVENPADRLTLDCGVHTDLGGHMPYGILEFKSSDPKAEWPKQLDDLLLHRTKISKFLWAMSPGQG